MEGPGSGMQDPSFDPERRPRQKTVVDDITSTVKSGQEEEPVVEDGGSQEGVGTNEPTT